MFLDPIRGYGYIVTIGCTVPLFKNIERKNTGQQGGICSKIETATEASSTAANDGTRTKKKRAADEKDKYLWYG